MHFLTCHQLAVDCQFPTSDQLVVRNVGNSESAFFGTPCSICDRCKKQLNWGQSIMDCDATEKGLIHNCENAMFISATLLPEVEAGTGWQNIAWCSENIFLFRARFSRSNMLLSLALLLGISTAISSLPQPWFGHFLHFCHRRLFWSEHFFTTQINQGQLGGSFGVYFRGPGPI